MGKKGSEAIQELMLITLIAVLAYFCMVNIGKQINNSSQKISDDISSYNMVLQ